MTTQDTIFKSAREIDTLYTEKERLKWKETSWQKLYKPEDHGNTSIFKVLKENDYLEVYTF